MSTFDKAMFSFFSSALAAAALVIGLTACGSDASETCGAPGTHSRLDRNGRCECEPGYDWLNGSGSDYVCVEEQTGQPQSNACACGDAICGDNGCGGSCGSCPIGMDCVTGQCQVATAPPRWTCAEQDYNQQDGCHCGCGAYDPDCSIPGAILVGCEGTGRTACDWAGVCGGDCAEGYVLDQESDRCIFLAESSGVDRDKTLGALSWAEGNQLCAWSIARQGGAGTEYDCGDGWSVEVESVSACVAGLSGLTCAVAVMEDCIHGVDGDACQIFESPICEPFVTCVLGG